MRPEKSVALEARISAIRTYLNDELRDRIRRYVSLIPHMQYELTDEMTQVRILITSCLLVGIVRRFVVRNDSLEGFHRLRDKRD